MIIFNKKEKQSQKILFNLFLCHFLIKVKSQKRAEAEKIEFLN